MPTAQLKLLLIGPAWDLPYDTIHCDPDSDVLATVAAHRPDVLVTAGALPPALVTAPFQVRKRWIDLDPAAPPEAVVQAVETCYRGALWDHPLDGAQPLVSVFTGTYQTGDLLFHTYGSLVDQTYPNWEWVVVDDGSDDGTWERLQALAARDIRVRPLRIPHNGKIGAVKRLATRAALGVYLVELDHDDQLTADALDHIREAFQADPDLGMVYSNFAECLPDGRCNRYQGPPWDDRYRETTYRGRTYLECRAPDVYGRMGPHYTEQIAWFLTVGPNHVRAFRASELHRLGGYNPELPVADDWDLTARFFLHSRCRHIDRLLYLYRFLPGRGNTTFRRNQAIQDHLAMGRDRYREAFIRAHLANPRPPGDLG